MIKNQRKKCIYVFQESYDENQPIVSETSEPIDSLRSSSKTSQAKGKFLNLITWVKFTNDECSASTGENGTCYTTQECTEFGGKASGTCASGFGVCCVLQVHVKTMGSESAVYSRYMVKQWVRCMLHVYSRYMFKQWVRSLLCTPGIWLNNGFGVSCVLLVYV